jgi:2-haloacid dehalogenase
MTRAPTRAVVLDIGGVLVDWDPVPALVAGLGEHEAHRLLAADDFDFHAWNVHQDRGRTFAEAEAEVDRTHPHWAGHVRAYFPNYPASLVGERTETVAVLREVLATRVPTYALTNWSAETFDHARARFGFLDDFADVLVSGELALLKPEPEIFAALLRRTGTDPAETFFADDSERNVAGALAAGLDAVHYTDAATLRGDLVSRGVLRDG